MLDLYDLTPPRIFDASSGKSSHLDFEESLEFVDWGMIDYKLALEKQLELLHRIAEFNAPGVIVFCTHPPVVTLGRATQDQDVTDWAGPRIEVSRGGRATYHGPSQLVVYPIINLKYSRKTRGPQEIVGYLRDFEKAIVETLKLYGVSSVGKSLQKKSELHNDSVADETGVWVENQKIASLGVAVKKWVTYHGAAINLDHDPMAFQGLRPCGFSPSTMVSLQQLSGNAIDRQDFIQKLQGQLSTYL